MIELEETLRRGLRAAADEGPAFVAPDLAGVTTTRLPRSRRRWPVLVAAAAGVLVAGGIALAVLRPDPGVSSADCAFVVDWDQQRWIGTGTDRTPVAGEVLGRGTVPGCDDMGQGPGPSREVVVRAIRGVDPDAALLVDGSVLLPESSDGALPAGLRDARDPVRCELGGTVRIEGQWVGVTSSREARFDGDVRPPYSADFRTADPRVTDGYAEVLLQARGTTASQPLAPGEVTRMLQSDDPEVLTTHCEGGSFVVDSIEP